MGMSPFEIVSACAALVIFWARVEHRLTRLEMKIKDLNCPACGNIGIKKK